MKKQLLLGATLLSSVFISNAQEVLLSQNFNDTDAVYDSGWGAYDLDGNESAFSVYLENATITAAGFNAQVAGSGNFTVSGGNAVPAPDTDNLWWSPNVELPEGEDAYLTLKIATLPLQEGAVAPYTIYIVGDEEAAAIEAIETIEAFQAYLDGLTPSASGDAPETATSMNVDLSAYAGQTVSVIFRHYQTDLLAYLMMDDVEFRTGVLSVKSPIASQFSIYPNPATDVINISNADNIHVNSVAVVDLNGRTVKTLKFDGVTEAAINISDLSAGMYLLNVSSDKGTMTKKIVKN